MGKVKDLMFEEERKWDLLNENLEALGVVDDETHGKMLERYIEEKGLTNVDDFDVEDWNKWSERKLVYDMRNAEQRENEPENTKIISLQEVIGMTEEEAEENGVGHIKKMWHNELEEEYRERQKINTFIKTYPFPSFRELVEIYLPNISKRKPDEDMGMDTVDMDIVKHTYENITNTELVKLNGRIIKREGLDRLEICYELLNDVIDVKHTESKDNSKVDYSKQIQYMKNEVLKHWSQ